MAQAGTVRDDVPVAPENRWLFGVCAVGSVHSAVSGVILAAETETPGRWFMASCGHNFEPENGRARWAPRDVWAGLNHGGRRVKLRSVEGTIHPEYRRGRAEFDVSASLVTGGWFEGSELFAPPKKMRVPRDCTILGYPASEVGDDPQTPQKDRVLKMMALPTLVERVAPTLVTRRDTEPGYSGGPVVVMGPGPRLTVVGLVSRAYTKGRGECCSLVHEDVWTWLQATAKGWGFRL